MHGLEIIIAMNNSECKPNRTLEEQKASIRALVNECVVPATPALPAPVVHQSMPVMMYCNPGVSVRLQVRNGKTERYTIPWDAMGQYRERRTNDIRRNA